MIQRDLTISNGIDRAWAILFARLVLGLIFFMAGVMKVFQLGALNHAIFAVASDFVSALLCGSLRTPRLLVFRGSSTAKGAEDRRGTQRISSN